MQNLAAYYIRNLSKENLYELALKKEINLSMEELEFSYNFIKSNYETVLGNPTQFNFKNYEQHYTKENYEKIATLIETYSSYL